MTFEFHDGDLLESGEPIIAHGANCRGVMGAGIALQIAQTYPDVLVAYQGACKRYNFRLGSAQPVWTERHGDERCVINLGTQKEPGPNATAWGVFLSFANLAEWCANLKITRVAIPRIAAGIGGLNWQNVVQPTIQKALNSATQPLTIAVYDIAPFRERATT